jgi:hypothetical protein
VPKRVASGGAQEQMMPGRSGIAFSRAEGEREEDRGPGRDKERAANRKAAPTRRSGEDRTRWASGNEGETVALALRTAARLGSNPRGDGGRAWEKLESRKFERVERKTARDGLLYRREVDGVGGKSGGPPTDGHHARTGHVFAEAGAAKPQRAAPNPTRRDPQKRRPFHRDEDYFL